MKSIILFIFRALFALGKMLLILATWLLLTAGLTLLWHTTPLGKIHYQNNDIPEKSFRVLIINADGFRQPETWENAQKLPSHQWVNETETPEQCGENCLRQTPDGTLIWHDEHAFAYTESEYRIDGDHLYPVSWLQFTFIHAFMAMFGAILLMLLGKYAFRCWQYRHSREQMAVYQKAVGRNLLIWVIATVVLAGLYWIMKTLQAA